MAHIRQSICFWCFNRQDLPFPKLCAEAKRIGYAGFEMVPEDQWKAVQHAGLKIITHMGHGTLTNGLNRKENHERIAGESRATIDKAVAHSIPALICFSGNREGLPDDTGANITAAGLKLVAGYAEQQGVTLILELLNSKVNHKDYQCDKTTWGVEVIKRVGSPRVKLLYDIYHMQIMEGDLIRTPQEHMEHIGHIHTAGNPGRNELDDNQEINYPGVMRAIAASAYTGYVGQEFMPKGDPIASLEAAYQLCNVG